MAMISDNILILLMLLEASLLSQIATKNIVKLTISQTQLQTNFQLILKALRSHDSSIENLQARLANLENSDNIAQKNRKQAQSNQYQKLLKEQLQRLQDEVKNLKEIFKLKMSSLEQMAGQLKNQIQKQQANPQSDSQNEKQIEEIKKNLQNLQQKYDKISQKVAAHDGYGPRIQKLESDLKEQSKIISSLDQSLKELKEKESLGKDKKQKSNESNVTQQGLNKLLSALESKFNQKMKEHEKSNQREYQSINDKINQIMKNHLAKINESIADQHKISKKLSDDLWKLNEQLYNLNRIDTVDPKKVTQLEKRIFSLEQSLANLAHKDPFKQQNGSTISKTISTAHKIEVPEFISTPHRKETVNQKQQVKDLSQIKQQANNEDRANFKKQIIDKLKQQKGDFAKALKKLDNFNLKKDEQKMKIGNLQEKILKIQFILEGKVDDQGLKKWMRYIENKISYLYRIVNVQSPEEDACIARKNWICLSCDKKLDAYKGKVGSHLASAQLKGKNIEHDVVGGGMLFRSKSRYDMPSIKK